MRSLLVAMLLLVVAGCAGQAESGTPAATSQPTSPSAPASEAPTDVTQRHPDIVDAELEPQSGDTYDVVVTVSSPYDTPQRYADGWRVLAPDGTELGTHTLAHDHANEQPFTRTQSGVEIPAGVDEVTIEGRDQRYGFGGGTVTVPVPRSG